MSVFTHILRVLTGDSNQNLRATEEHADRTEKSLRRLESRAGRVGSASTKMAGLLGRVSPELGEMAMLTNDAADGFEVLSGSGASVLRVLGPVAAAAGVMAGAYFVLKSRLDEATAAMEESAKKSAEMAEVHLQVRDAALMAAVAEGKLEEAEFNRIIAARDAQSLFAAQKANQQERIDGLNRERETLEKAIELQRQHSESGVALEVSGNDLAGQLMGPEESVQASNQLDKLNKKLEQNVNSTVLAQRALGILDVGQTRHAASLETVANATGNVTRATREMTEAMREAIEVTREFNPSAIPGITPDLGRLIPAIQTEDILAQDQAVTDAMIRDSRQQALGQVAGAVQMAGAPAQALGMLGPAGAILGGLASIGAAGGASGVEKQLDTLNDNIIDGVTALPAILTEVIPDFVSALVTDLPPALARAIGEIMIEIMQQVLPGRFGDEKDLTSAEVFERQDFLRSIGAGSDPGTMFLGVDRAVEARNSRQAASRGRVARADGATRMAMSRAPTAQMMTSPSLTINALGVDDGTQDQFQRRFARYTDPNTGLRGRDG